MKRVLSLLLCLLQVPALVKADQTTAFNIKSVTCSTNSATISYASCGMSGNDPCEMGDFVSLSGTYTVTTTVPQVVEVCGKVQVFGIQVYNAGCWENVDICEYIDCSNSGTEDYIDDNGSPYYYSFDEMKIPGNSRWLGGGYGFGFKFSAYGDDGSELESCKITVSATSISTSAAVMAVASVCAAAAAIYYRRKRRTATIDLEKEENLVQTDFVELSRTGVSV